MTRTMTRTCHLICNSHIDPVWLWEWEEGAAVAISTFRCAADFCEEFGGFIFNHNEVILYQWVEEYEPALFKRIQKLVKQGRWHIMGGWFLQPDCNMPAGESFVRQILLGRTYFREKFGVEPTTAINFDPFGHSRGLVQIMAKSGFDSYVFTRPGNSDCPLPAETFRWIGYDGSEVLGVRLEAGYNSGLGKARQKIETQLKEQAGWPVGVVLWGVGNHGGGPSRQDIKALGALMKERQDVNIVHSTPEAYFAEVRASGQELPAHAGDLNLWAPGCYTSQVRLKQRHRRLENELFMTEKMCTAAAAQKLMAYPRAELTSAQRDLATAQFHDILPGSSVQPVEETSLRLMDHALEQLSRVKARAFFALAAGQPVAKDGEIPILVFNPHPFPVDTEVECEFGLIDGNWDPVTWTLADAYAGAKALPTQIEKEISNLNLDWRKRVVFRATLAPGVMNRFDCRMRRVESRPVLPARPADGGLRFANADGLEVAIDPATGLLESWRVAGRDLVRPGALKPLVLRDDGDPWGSKVRSFREVAGEFTLLDPAESARFAGVDAPTLPPLRVIEDGAVRTVVEAGFGYGSSRLLLRYELPKQGTEIGLELRVLWNEKDRMLKLSLPTALAMPEYRGQVAYGWNALPMNGDEAVAQQWVAVVSATDAMALTVINQGSYGSDFCDGELRLSLLRSSAYSALRLPPRPLLVQDRYLPRIDQGERLFRFWFNGGPAPQRLEAIDSEALARNEQPMALSFFPSGQGTKPKAVARLADGVVQLTALKRAERGEDVIVRLFEPTGQARRTVLHLPCLGIKQVVKLKGFEIATLRINTRTGKVQEADLMEKVRRPR